MTEECLVKTLLESRIPLIVGASAVVRDMHQAEDVFQEVLIRALRTRDTFTEPAGLLAWARVTARNLAIDQVRRRNRLAHILSEVAVDAVGARVAASAETVPARADAMRHCLERLPVESRQMLRLRYDAGHNGHELARLLKRSEAAVYKALSRLHHALKKCIDERLAAEGAT